MAHEIDTTTGKEAAFFAGEPAWHRLGTVVKDCQTSAEAIQLACLDWQVAKIPLFASEDASNPSLTIPAPGLFATVRTDTRSVLGAVGSQYRPFQNAEAFDFMDKLVGEKLAMFETAGSLKGGRRVWMLAKLPGDFQVAKDDEVRPYILLTNSHDGTSTIRMIPTTVRVVCWNTLSLALRYAKSDEGLSITHTTSLENRVNEARAKLGIVVKRHKEFQQQAQALVRRKLSQEEMAAYFAKMCENRRSEKGQKTQMEKFFELLNNERNTLKGIKGSAWAAYNAVSEYADHEMRVMGDNEEKKMDNRLNSMWFGVGNRLKQNAFEAALALAV